MQINEWGPQFIISAMSRKVDRYISEPLYLEICFRYRDETKKEFNGIALLENGNFDLSYSRK